MLTPLIMVMMLLLSSIGAVAALVTAELPTPSDRAEQMLRNMTLDEKMRIMRGCTGDYVGNIEGNARLKIPAISMQDGPQGFRITKKTGAQGTSTAWPSSLNIAASFDPDLAYRWAVGMTEEFVLKGSNMNLSPGLGIARVPTAGRNFEYLCGEDPYLGGILGAQVVKGIQSKGVIANAKHFVNNEIEKNRMTVSSTVDEKIRFQIYYPPFQAAIDAGVLSIMCSYNLINGKHACENDITLNELRTIMGFQGFVLSDWLAAHSTVASIEAGLDQELPYGIFLSGIAIQSALAYGGIKISQIDRSVLRILTAMYTIGLFDTPEDSVKGDPLADVTSEEHSLLAREVAAKSIVLVKNSKNLLPLDKLKLKRIGVFGDESTVSGNGSGHVSPSHGHIVTATEGITAAVIGYDISVEYFKIPDGVDKDNGLNIATAFAAQCDVIIVVVATTSGEGYDRPSLQLGNGQDELVLALYNSNPHIIVVVMTPGAVLMPWANDISTILICFLPGEQAGNGLADVLFNTHNPSARLPITMPNIDNEMEFTPGQYPGVGSPPVATYTEGLLVGYRWYDAHDVTPMFPFGHGLSYTTFEYKNIIITESAKLGAESGVDSEDSNDSSEILTLPISMFQSHTPSASTTTTATTTDTATDAVSGTDTATDSDTSSSIEKTTTLSNISRFDQILTITATITNTGTYSGTEVAQLYITYPNISGEPLRQLRGVKNMFLPPGGVSNITFIISSQDISVWDTESHTWVLDCPQNTEINKNIYSIQNINDIDNKQNKQNIDNINSIQNAYNIKNIDNINEFSVPKDEEIKFKVKSNTDCNFIFSIGSSSRDIRLKGELKIN